LQEAIRDLENYNRNLEEQGQRDHIAELARQYQELREFFVKRIADQQAAIQKTEKERSTMSPEARKQAQISGTWVDMERLMQEDQRILDAASRMLAELEVLNNITNLYQRADAFSVLEQRKATLEFDYANARLAPSEVAEKHQRLIGALQRLIKTFQRYVEQGTARMNAMSPEDRNLAMSAGTWAGMEQTVAEEQRIIDVATHMMMEVHAANETPDIYERDRLLSDLEQRIQLLRPDYRSANGTLMRARDLLQQYGPTLERAPFEAGQEVYALVGNDVVQRVQGNRIEVTKNGAMLVLTDAQMWHVREIEGGVAFNPNVPRHVIAEMLNRRRNLLRRYATLTEEDYHALFDGPLQQQNTGNCYMIAAMESLRNSPHAEAVLRTSVRREGTTFVVTLPLGDALGEPITVTEAEMGAVRHRGEDLQPVRAAAGWIALEAAIMKKTYGTVDRPRANEGGRAETSLELMLGSAVDQQILTVLSGFREEAEQWLNTFSTQRSIATASTRPHPRGDQETFTVGGMQFHYSHAYAILNVDARNQTVIVANPHNTGVHMRLTYDQFIQAFLLIRSVRVNYTTMFRT
jgi:hypothetical protein